MSQDIRQGKKRFKKHWVILLFFIVGAVIFHQPILLAGCKFVLNTIIPKSQGRTVGYKTMQWEEKAIAISGLEIKDLSSELKIDRIELRLKWDFLHFCFKPEMTVLHPQITFAANASNSAPFLPFLYRTNWFQPRWEIKDGVIRLPSQTCFYFSLSAKQDPSSIGNLLFSYDPNPLISPMISADLSTREDLLQVGLELRTTSLKKLLPITALIVPEISREWEKADGDVEFTGLICFSKAYQIQELHCHGSGKSIDLRGPVMGIDVRAEEVRGNFSYPVAETSGSFWDQLSATVLLKKGFCLLQAPIIKQPVGMDGLEGELKFQPKEEPTLTLKGALIKEDQRMPFDLQGKGRVQEDHTFWSELEFNGNSLHGYHMQAFLSLCSDQAKDITLHAKVENAAFEHLDFLRAFSAIPGRCVEGKANLEATLVYAGGKWQKTSIEKCLMENIRWYFPEKQMTAYADQITTIGSLEKNEDVWNLADLHLQLNAGDYLDPHMHIEDFTSIVVVDKGILQSAECKGSWGELKAGIAFVNAEDGPCTQCDLKGDAKELLSFFSKAQFPKSVLIDMHAQAKFDKGNLRITTDATVAKEPIKASALLNYSPICSSEILLGKLPKFTFKEGQFQADALTAQSYDAFFAVLFPDLNLEGKLQCKATFSPTSIQIQAGGEQLVLKHLWATLFLPQLKEKNAQFSYDVTQKQWRGEIPLKEAALEYRSLGLPFTNIEGALKLEGNHLRSNAFYAECEGLALRGNLDLSFENGQIALSTSQVAGDAKSLFAVLNHFPALSKIDLPIMGDFSSADKGFVLNAGMGKDAADWSFKGSFANLHFPLNSATSITDGHCEVQFDSKTNRLVLEKAEGVWKLKDGMPMTVQLKRFSLHAEEGVDFAVKVVDGKREFAHFEGRANKTAKSLWDITFDKQLTHFGGIPLNITRCQLDEMMKPISFEIKPTLKCQDLHAQAAFLQNAGFLSPQFSPKNLQDWQLEGTVQARLSSDDIENGFAFHAESSDLKVKGKPWPSFHLSGQKIKEKWLIEKLEAGHLSLKGAFLVDAGGVSFPKLEGRWQGIEMKGSAYLKPESKRFSCTFESIKGDLAALKFGDKTQSAFALKGTYAAGAKVTGDYSNPQDPLKMTGEANLYVDVQSPLAMTGTSTKTVKFTYSTTNGMLCEGVDLQLKHRISNAFLGEIKLGKISYVEKGDLSLQKLQFSIAPAVLGYCIDAKIIPASIRELNWEGNLEGNGDLTIGSKGNVFTGTLKSGRYGFSDKSLMFDQLQLRYEKEALVVRAKTKIEDQPLWGVFQIDFGKESCGLVKIYDNPKAEGMRFVFTTQSGKISWESIEGSCYGISCHLNKSTKRKIPQATVLSGELKINDNQIYALLPAGIQQGLENFKFGSGYNWQGDLILWQEANRGFQASGILRGSEFELFGYRFYRLEGVLEANLERLTISDIKIDDPAGAVAIKKIELKKEEQWQLNIPQIVVKQLQPSMMQKVSGEPQTVKPFTIKNFIMKDIRGKLGDKSSLEGSGHLSFANQFKKESSIFDVPLEMIKKIGLDPGLLTPIQGELDVELRGDKFYLLSLQNSFSDGNRAEFYLSPHTDLSYIDLDGKVHIDLNMRQEVMLKVTEAFTLTIRGTLDKPRYGLQY